MSESHQPDRSAPGLIRNRHYTNYVDTVKQLRRAEHEEEAERLLLELVEATEAENELERLAVA